MQSRVSAISAVKELKDRLKTYLVVEDEEFEDSSCVKNKQFLMELAKEYLSMNMKLEEWEKYYAEGFVESLYHTLSSRCMQACGSNLVKLKQWLSEHRTKSKYSSFSNTSSSSSTKSVHFYDDEQSLVERESNILNNELLLEDMEEDHETNHETNRTETDPSNSLGVTDEKIASNIHKIIMNIDLNDFGEYYLQSNHKFWILYYQLPTIQYICDSKDLPPQIVNEFIELRELIKSVRISVKLGTTETSEQISTGKFTLQNLIKSHLRDNNIKEYAKEETQKSLKLKKSEEPMDTIRAKFIVLWDEFKKLDVYTIKNQWKDKEVLQILIQKLQTVNIETLIKSGISFKDMKMFGMQYKEILLIAWKNKSKTKNGNGFKFTYLHKYYLELLTETCVAYKKRIQSKVKAFMTKAFPNVNPTYFVNVMSTQLANDPEKNNLIVAVQNIKDKTEQRKILLWVHNFIDKSTIDDFKVFKNKKQNNTILNKYFPKAIKIVTKTNDSNASLGNTTTTNCDIPHSTTNATNSSNVIESVESSSHGNNMTSPSTRNDPPNSSASISTRSSDRSTMKVYLYIILIVENHGNTRRVKVGRTSIQSHESFENVIIQLQKRYQTVIGTFGVGHYYTFPIIQDKHNEHIDFYENKFKEVFAALKCHAEEVYTCFADCISFPSLPAGEIFDYFYPMVELVHFIATTGDNSVIDTVIRRMKNSDSFTKWIQNNYVETNKHVDPGDNFFEVLQSCESRLKDQFTEDIISIVTTTQLLKTNNRNINTFKAPEYLTRNDMRTIICNVTEKSLGKNDEEKNKKEEEQENTDANLSSDNFQSGANKKRKINKEQNKNKKRRTLQEAHFNSSAATYNQQGETKLTKVMGVDNIWQKILGLYELRNKNRNRNKDDWMPTNHKLNNGCLKGYELKLKLDCLSNRFVFHYRVSNKNNIRAQYVDKIQLKFDVHNEPGVGCEFYFSTLFDNEHPSDIKAAVELFFKETICFHFRLLFTICSNNKNTDFTEAAKTKKCPLYFIMPEQLILRYFFTKFVYNKDTNKEDNKLFVESIIDCIPNQSKSPVADSTYQFNCVLQNDNINKISVSHKNIIEDRKAFVVYFQTDLKL